MIEARAERSQGRMMQGTEGRDCEVFSSYAKQVGILGGLRAEKCNGLT